MGILSTIGSYLAGTLTVFLAFKFSSERSKRRLPPGPRALPLIGNLLDIPTSQEWLTWKAYVDRYGDLVNLTVLGTNYLLLGSHQAIADLLEKRSHFNDRPCPTMMCDLMDLGWNLSFIPYGSLWRRGRKIIHSQTHAHAAKTYQHIQLRGARKLVYDLLVSETTRSQDRFSEAAKRVLPQIIQRNFAFTAVHMIYGINVRDPVMEARYVDVPEAVTHAISEGSSPGRFWVDYLPILRYVPAWFPGAQFQHFAKKSATLGKQMRDDPIAYVKKQMASGVTHDSMASHMLKHFPEDEQLVKDIAGITYIGGSDTTFAAVTSYFLAALVYPEVQQRVREELDRVVGRVRFPDFSDKDSLPYLEGVMRECIRWLPVVPNGDPDSDSAQLMLLTTQDDEYRGYFIPKGTVVLPFQWGLLHDGNVYPEPAVFSPERYLTSQSNGSWTLRDDVVDPRTFAFGFGRRVCPGKNIAEQGLFATLTTVIHTLDITRPKDDHGREITPEVQMTSGLMCHPSRTRCGCGTTQGTWWTCALQQ